MALLLPHLLLLLLPTTMHVNGRVAKRNRVDLGDNIHLMWSLKERLGAPYLRLRVSLPEPYRWVVVGFRGVPYRGEVWEDLALVSITHGKGGVKKEVSYLKTLHVDDQNEVSPSRVPLYEWSANGRKKSGITYYFTFERELQALKSCKDIDLVWSYGEEDNEDGQPVIIPELFQSRDIRLNPKPDCVDKQQQQQQQQQHAPEETPETRSEEEEEGDAETSSNVDDKLNKVHSSIFTDGWEAKVHNNNNGNNDNNYNNNDSNKEEQTDVEQQPTAKQNTGETSVEDVGDPLIVPTQAAATTMHAMDAAEVSTAPPMLAETNPRVDVETPVGDKEDDDSNNDDSNDNNEGDNNNEVGMNLPTKLATLSVKTTPKEEVNTHKVEADIHTVAITDTPLDATEPSHIETTVSRVVIKVPTKNETSKVGVPLEAGSKVSSITQAAEVVETTKATKKATLPKKKVTLPKKEATTLPPKKIPSVPKETEEEKGKASVTLEETSVDNGEVFLRQLYVDMNLSDLTSSLQGKNLSYLNEYHRRLQQVLSVVETVKKTAQGAVKNSTAGSELHKPCVCDTGRGAGGHWYDFFRDNENSVYFAVIGISAFFTGAIVLCLACCCARKSSKAVRNIRKSKVSFYKVDDFESSADEVEEFLGDDEADDDLKNLVKGHKGGRKDDLRNEIRPKYISAYGIW